MVIYLKTQQAKLIPCREDDDDYDDDDELELRYSFPQLPVLGFAFTIYDLFSFKSALITSCHHLHGLSYISLLFKLSISLTGILSMCPATSCFYVCLLLYPFTYCKCLQ